LLRKLYIVLVKTHKTIQDIIQFNCVINLKLHMRAVLFLVWEVLGSIYWT